MSRIFYIFLIITCYVISRRRTGVTFTCFEALVGVCSAPGIGDVLVAVTQSLTASITIDCTLDPPVIRKHFANQLQLCGERVEV